VTEPMPAYELAANDRAGIVMLLDGMVPLAAIEVSHLGAANFITSAGRDATQTVFHLHIHIVPRHAGDGLALPWTGQVTQ
jgi:diadenosine tetraphosphate (Ap4A) HIT family hydrolase